MNDRFVLVPGDNGQVLSLPDPVVRIDYDAPHPPCLRQRPGLRLAAPWEEIHFFLRHRVEALGEAALEPNGDLAVQLARKRHTKGQDWGLFQAELEALTRDPLAPRYRGALRAWYGDGGLAQSCTVPLVRFTAPEICDAVMGLSDLANCVEGRLGLFTLVIRGGQLARFKRGLKAHGLAAKPTTDPMDDGEPDTWAIPWMDENRKNTAAAEEPPEEQKKPARKRAKSLSKTKPPRQAPATADSPESATARRTLPSYPPRIVREILEDAIARRRSVLLEYQPSWGEQPTVRTVNPAAMDPAGATPTLSAYCHRNNGSRTFRLSRILGIRVLEDETF